MAADAVRPCSVSYTHLWAKVFNLKQMAQTLNYLSEHGLLDYADLATKTAEATARYNALSLSLIHI